MEIVCARCGVTAEAMRPTRRFCSDRCSRLAREQRDPTRNCRHCGKQFDVVTRADANRQHCSKACSKRANRKRIKGWQQENPEAMRSYGRKWSAKNPGYYRDKARRERLAILELLGGRCVVCAVSNPYWLHVDYIPTTRDMPYRHPRNIGFVRRNMDDFRVLCANHHYELTLTGAIKGTSITQ